MVDQLAYLPLNTCLISLALLLEKPVFVANDDHCIHGHLSIKTIPTNDGK